MLKSKFKKAISYIFADDENFNLENRIILSSVIFGILISIFASLVNLVLTTSVTSVVIPIALSAILIMVYYFMRFKKIIKPFFPSIIIISFAGIAVIWISNGGLNSSNIIPALVILMISLLAVSDRKKLYVLITFLAFSLTIYLIQYYRPDLITDFPSEKDRWIDAVITLIYSSFFIYLIVKYLHKNYSLERIKVEESEQKLLLLNNNKDQFISMLAHDLRSPFNSILGYLDILKSNIHNYDKKTIDNQLNIISASTQNTYQLLEDILLWATSQSGKIQFAPQQLSLNRILQGVFDFHVTNASTKNITLALIPMDKAMIYADLNMLKAILRNIISNAIKFTDPGGRIEISAINTEVNCVISIRDNGKGMSKDTINHLWDFSNLNPQIGTSGEKGAGLGLSLSRDFVYKHKGEIKVESELGIGTIFYVSFPNSTVS